MEIATLVFDSAQKWYIDNGVFSVIIKALMAGNFL